MLEPELRQPVEVWLAMDNDGVGVRVYSQDNRLADAYRAGAPSLDAAQGEITAHYTNVVTPLMASGARNGGARVLRDMARLSASRLACSIELLAFLPSS